MLIIKCNSAHFRHCDEAKGGSAKTEGIFAENVRF